MNYKAYPVGVHINENSVKMLDGIVQNDNGNLFQVQLYSGSDAYDFSGYALINATIIRPDETTIADIWTAQEYEPPYDPEEDDIIATPAEEQETVSDTETSTDGDVTEGSHTFLAIQYLDPENGRITFKVGGDATAMVGLHRMALEFYSEDARVTTARINYRVVETLNNIDQTILDNSDSYVALQSLLSECANILDAEQERANQEAVGTENEEVRTAAYTALLAEMQEELDFAQALFDQAIAQGQMDDLYAHVDSYIDENLGCIPTTSNVASWFAQHTDAGMMVYCTADELVYVGTGSGAYRQLITYAPYAAGSTAPTDTRSLWIDTANGSIVKYWSGSAWVSTGAVALFG